MASLSFEMSTASGAALGVEDKMGVAMMALAKNPQDKAAEAVVSTDRSYHSMLRTTCVATLLEGGHANNALPQHAQANINCRIFPGVSVESVAAKLQDLVADPEVKVITLETRSSTPPPPPLTPAVLGPVEKLAAEFFPGVPVLPILQAGATDGAFLNATGIPTCGGF